MIKQFRIYVFRVTFVTLALLACVDKANAGRHHSETDDFDGSVTSVYVATKAEKAKAGFDFMLASYQANDETMLLALTTPLGNACDRENIELKTSEGVIHSLKALVGKDARTCVVAVYVTWVKKSFSVRIPMVDRASLVGKFDTRTLKPEQYLKSR